MFGDRSKIPTEPPHFRFRQLWVRSDQTPPTFRPFTERIFLRSDDSDQSDQADRRFRTHPTLYVYFIKTTHLPIVSRYVELAVFAISTADTGHTANRFIQITFLMYALRVSNLGDVVMFRAVARGGRTVRLHMQGADEGGRKNGLRKKFLPEN